MAQNLMVGTHKYSSKKWRDNYDKIFDKNKKKTKGVSCENKTVKR